MESIEWSDEATEALIELWQTKDELFCRNHPYFYAKDYKDRAIEQIRVKMEEKGFHTTTNQILGKIQSLRTYFCSQRAKFQQLKKAGHITDEDSECRWRFYKSLQFLDENMKPRENIKKEKHDMDGSSSNGYEGPGNYMASMAYEPQSHRIEQRFLGNDTTSENKSIKIINNRNESENQTKFKQYEDQLFGELVGNMISQLPSGQHKDLLKLEIQQMIISAKYDNKVLPINPHHQTSNHQTSNHHNNDSNDSNTND